MAIFTCRPITGFQVDHQSYKSQILAVYVFYNITFLLAIEQKHLSIVVS